jgi:hypothetical protein
MASAAKSKESSETIYHGLRRKHWRILRQNNRLIYPVTQNYLKAISFLSCAFYNH